jgi:hypothetical protein
MSAESPASVIYSSLGVEVTLANGGAVPASQAGLMIDGYNYSSGLAQLMAVDSSGHVIVVGSGTAGTAATGVVTIQGIAGMTAVTVNNATAANLLANVGGLGAAGASPSGNPLYMGGSVTTSAPSYSNATMNALSLDTSGNLRVTGNFNNASVSATASAPPASATYIGGSVTTAAPAYTTGQMNALSLTTAGQLRVDGAYPLATAAATAADMMQVGGAVTTAAPTYTTATTNALSLTTAGALRVDGSGVTQPVSGTVTANAGTGTFNVAGTGTAGTPNAGVVTIQGIAGGTAIPVSGNLTVDKSTTATLTSVAANQSSVSLLASNANRLAATLYNDSTSQVYIAFAATATTTAFTIKLMPNTFWEVTSDWTGAISGIWNNANGSMRITEMS